MFNITNYQRNANQNYYEALPYTSQNDHHQSLPPPQKSLQIINAREGVEKREPYYTVSGNVNWCNHYGKTVWGLFKKLKIELLYDPAIPLPGIYPEKTMTQKNTCPQCSLWHYIQ